MNDEFPESIGAGRIVLVGTGAIAVCHLPTVVTLLRRHYRVETVVCLTESARTMVSPQAVETLSGHPVVPADWSGAAGPIHVEWAEWAEAVLVWPATLHFLAACAAGLAGDVPTSIVLSTRAPVVLAPCLAAGAVRGGPYRRIAEALEADGRHLVGPVTGHSVSAWQLTEGACAPPDAALRALGRVTSETTANRTHERDRHDQHHVSPVAQ
ncbi:flavoprotein [Prauserella cavernicola]|uniref:Flavoprotein domain-containing protein n=1 Tax=Prauserella cavernicola TaxID=2800127 RepID=A0A934V8P2_9PSEU|nr:flavoprotein [Prauserella cavernicola]MBK1787993.1 hypothetical protein [Prauserella cavernicola]